MHFQEHREVNDNVLQNRSTNSPGESREISTSATTQARGGNGNTTLVQHGKEVQHHPLGSVETTSTSGPTQPPVRHISRAIGLTNYHKKYS